MKVKDLIAELEKMPKDHDIVVTGMYGSDASDIYVKVATSDDYGFKEQTVLLMTDLMTG